MLFICTFDVELHVVCHFWYANFDDLASAKYVTAKHVARKRVWSREIQLQATGLLALFLI